MTSIILGILSALSLGSADFIGRMSSEKYGYGTSSFGTLLLGCLMIVPLLWSSDIRLSLTVANITLMVVHGIFFACTIMLLYRAFARGPIGVVAPIIAAHPLLVVLFAVLLGTRANLSQWIAMVVVMTSIYFIAHALPLPEVSGSPKHAPAYFRKTLIIAATCSVAYAAMIITGQYAALTNSEWVVLFMGRFIAMAVMLIFAGKLISLSKVPFRGWGWLSLQGGLDAFGVYCLLAGGHTPHPEMTAVVASAFFVVTVILSRIFLKEGLSPVQVGATICLVFGVGILVASG